MARGVTDITQTDPDLNLFLFTRPAWMLSSTSATISTICSIFVIIFICRSHQLTSVYHKIMLFMASWDAITSLAIALVTLPLPSDIYDIYPFDGIAVGNLTTCKWQGFIIFVGCMYTMWSNCTLNIYYVCTIKYGMSEESIKRRALPIMFGISTVHVCVINIMLLCWDLYNPRPYEPFCLVGPYPHNCLMDNDVECIRGGNLSNFMDEFFTISMIVMGCLALLCMVASMVLVVVTVFKTELSWMQCRQTSNENSATNTGGDSSRNPSRRRHTSDFNDTRIALKQALMYIVAFILTWVWMGIALISPGKVWNDPLKMFFQPLQGFFNAAIFFSNKVHSLRKSTTASNSLTRWEAFRQVILSPWTVPLVVVSQIEMLDDNGDDDNSFIMEEINWNHKLRRTGILNSAMDIPPVSISSSNDVPNSYNAISCDLSSKDSMIMALSLKKDSSKIKSQTSKDITTMDLKIDSSKIKAKAQAPIQDSSNENSDNVNVDQVSFPCGLRLSDDHMYV